MAVFVVARTFRFGARELMTMTLRDLGFWAQGALEVLKLERGKDDT